MPNIKKLLYSSVGILSRSLSTEPIPIDSDNEINNSLHKIEEELEMSLDVNLNNYTPNTPIRNNKWYNNSH